MGQRSAPVDRKPVPADPHLRQLLRTGRRAAGNLSQRSAAQRAGISSVYWQKIESGALQAAPASTLATMFMAAGISGNRLRDEGYAEVASAVDELVSLATAPPTPEEHLAATPGATPEEINALQAVWLVLKTAHTATQSRPTSLTTRRQRRTA